MRILAFKRVEKKYLINSEQYNLLLSKITDYMELDPYCNNNATYKIQNIFISMMNVLSNSNFKHKEEILRMLNTSLPICIDEVFEDYLTFFYVTSQLAAGVVYADSISASNKGSAPRRPDPSKQKAIDEAIMLWKRTPRLSLDDVAGLIRDAEISDKSHSIIKQWIAPVNPNRKN